MLAIVKFIVKLILTTVLALIGFVAGAGFAVAFVYICCWTLSSFYTGNGAAGMIFYLGAFFALFMGLYAGAKGMVMAIHFSVENFWRANNTFVPKVDEDHWFNELTKSSKQMSDQQ